MVTIGDQRTKTNSEVRLMGTSVKKSLLWFRKGKRAWIDMNVLR